MSLRDNIAIPVGKLTYSFLHNCLHRGTSLPGKLTLKISPTVLRKLGQNYKVIIITGTNGKTLSTALTVQVLKQKYNYVLTNPSGSNLLQGIVATFLKSKKATNKHKRIAVLEVDEANVRLVTRYIKPIAVVITNIFRDQMDRYGEIYTSFKKIIRGIRQAPKATVIANGDDPMFQSVKLPNKIIYYGFQDQKDKDIKAKPNTDDVLCPKCQHILHYHYLTYANLGKYFCPNCGYSRPKLTYSVNHINNLTPTSSSFQIDGNDYKIDISGVYNIYNALVAYSVGRLLGVTKEQIQKAFQSNEHVFGRQEEINVNGRQITLILVKNPVGLNQVIDMISHTKEPFSFVWLLNANYADGIDTSWIWDGDFERLPKMNIRKVITGGERYKDITWRLKVAGIPDQIHQVELNLSNIVEDLGKLPTKKVYVLATYTAMMETRHYLKEQGDIR